MAPEQIVAGEIGPTTDIYSLGAVLYFMLSGRAPFTGDSDVEVLHAQLKSDPTPIHKREGCEGVPPALSAFIKKSMARKPIDRFQSAREFIAALVTLIQTAIVDPDYVASFQVGEPDGLAPSVLVSRESITPIQLQDSTESLIPTNAHLDDQSSVRFDPPDDNTLLYAAVAIIFSSVIIWWAIAFFL